MSAPLNRDLLYRWLLVVGLGIFALTRVGYVLLTDGGVIDADEAVVGLMGRRILEGDSYIYYAGQEYMGTLEAYTAAGVFAVFSASPFTLKMTVLLYAVAFTGVTVVLLRRVFSPVTGVFFFLLALCSPVFVLMWTLKARGGYVETLLFGSLLLWLLHEGLRGCPAGGEAEGRGPRSRWFLVLWGLQGVTLGVLVGQLLRDGFSVEVLGLELRNSSFSRPLIAHGVLLGVHAALARVPLREWLPRGRVWGVVAVGGLVSGLGWWTNQLVVFYLLPVWGVLFFARVRRFAEAAVQMRFTLAYLPAFVLGSLPVWIHRARQGPSEASIGEMVSGAVWIEQLRNLVRIGLPRLLGVFNTPEAHPARWVLDGVIAGIYLSAVLWLLGGALWRLVRERGRFFEEMGVREALLLLLLVYLPITARSAFGGFVYEPRYLLPFAVGLQCAVAILCSRLYAWRRVVGVAVLSVLMVGPLMDYPRVDFEIHQPRVRNRRVPRELEPLYEFLDAEGITAVFTDYWLAQRIAFETGERVNAVVFPGWAVERFPEKYAEAAVDPNFAYIVMESIAKGFEQTLREEGVRAFRRHEIAPLVIYYEMSEGIH